MQDTDTESGDEQDGERIELDIQIIDERPASWAPAPGE